MRSRGQFMIIAAVIISSMIVTLPVKIAPKPSSMPLWEAEEAYVAYFRWLLHKLSLRMVSSFLFHYYNHLKLLVDNDPDYYQGTFILSPDDPRRGLRVYVYGGTFYSYIIEANDKATENLNFVLNNLTYALGISYSYRLLNLSLSSLAFDVTWISRGVPLRDTEWADPFYDYRFRYSEEHNAMSSLFTISYRAIRNYNSSSHEGIRAHLVSLDIDGTQVTLKVYILDEKGVPIVELGGHNFHVLLFDGYVRVWFIWVSSSRLRLVNVSSKVTSLGNGTYVIVFDMNDYIVEYRVSPAFLGPPSDFLSIRLIIHDYEFPQPLVLCICEKL
ncbi:MAG: hypothetical protein DRN15_05910 [Thermoprotei archaeon]|nr:MAG: hypothetical protein DRN15_05910 [Thermoprotei archaeon]RLF23698.1 MAG: hypothetical protein DRM97_04435 [Thermoprotei archaeon]